MLVNVLNYRAAETARMFDNTLALPGARSNAWVHLRRPTPVDQQPVIRMNRDTLYSAAIIDIADGATVTLPDAGNRYQTMMVINEDHYINHVYSGAGTYELTMAEHGTPFVQATVRTFVDPADPDDVAEVNALQDAISVDSVGGRPYEHPDYDGASLERTSELLRRLGEGVPDSDHTFGSPAETEPTRHLIGTAMGWGGLPEREAVYYIESTPQSVGRYTFTFTDVPVDAFWSVSIYNRDGFFEANPYDSFSRNSVTSEPGPDGSITLDLGPDPSGDGNHLYVMDGWNYVLRLYRPHASVIDKTWTPPVPVPVD